MLNKEVSALLNNQINKELYSAYLYLDMSNYYYAQNLKGFSNWFMIQTQEERDHAMLFVTYMRNIGETIELTAIDAPGKVFNQIKDPVTIAFAHEQFVTSLIKNIYSVATQHNDAASLKVLDWFIKEQDEEERNTGSLVKRFEQCGDDPAALAKLDASLGLRKYSPPSLVL